MRAWHPGDTSGRLGRRWRLAAFCPVGLAPGTLNVIMLDRCRGDALVVTSADGENIGTIDEPACPDKLLRIGSAGSVRLEDH